MRLTTIVLLLGYSLFGQIPAYYSSIDFTQTGNALKNQLATLITTTHTNQLPYSSSQPDVWDALQAGDVTPNDPTKVFLIYGYDDFDAIFKNDRTDLVTNICSGSCPTGSWNREHCYAQSLATPALTTSTPGPGTDAHHIRASDVTFNADRGNRLYADGEGDAGFVGSNWYPGDEWKGDIARMMMYMYVRYNTRCLATNIGVGPTTYSVDMPDIFLEWNEEDPVSQFEINRNNTIQSFQGNRNPFIDNPYLATLIWGGPQAPDSWNELSCPNTTTWNGVSWNNGLPNKNTRAIINGDFTSSGNLEFCSLSIEGNSQVRLSSGDTFTVVRNISVLPSAFFLVENNANLIQINNIANSGEITVIKESSPLLRLDYTSWSSPVSGQNLLNFSPQTLPNRFYEYLTGGTTPQNAYNVVDPSLNDFVAGKGYIIRSPNNWSSSTPTSFIGQFSGIPNNGSFEINVQTGYSMLGNPYPATIDASHFIALNRTVETLYFWTHTIGSSGGVYPINNFASYTTLGGVASAAGGEIPDGTIKPGQGFYLFSKEDETILFHNALREDVKNSQFFRYEDNSIEKNIYRLNLWKTNFPQNQILIGYTENSSINFDFGIDGKPFDNTSSQIYTKINGENFIIEGRGNFTIEDTFNLGLKANESGLYSISIENKFGLFEDTSIYLKDNFTGSFIDLTKMNYSFMTEEGIFDNRFEIYYQKEESSNFNVLAENIFVNSNSNKITIKSSNSIISEVKIFDITGRFFYEKKLLENELEISSISKTNSPLIIQVYLDNGAIVSKKIIH